MNPFSIDHPRPEIATMPHSKNVKKAVEDFAAALAAGDQEAAFEALAEAQAQCCHQQKAKRGKTATGVGTADVVAACDHAIAAVRNRMATPGAAAVGAAGGWWNRFLQVAPMILEVLKEFFADQTP